MRNLLALLLFVPSLCLAQVPTYVPTDGLVGWWPFNGNAEDQSDFGNHGESAGAVPAVDRFGQFSAAYFFDGASAITIPHSSSIAPGSALTISCWFNPEESAIENGGTLISKGDQGYFWNYGSHIYPGGTPAYAYTFYSVGSGATIAGNNWTHLVFTLNTDLNEMVQYTNSVAETSMMNLNNSTTIEDFNNFINPCCNTSLVFGRNAGGNDAHFHGTIDDVAIWDRALNADEVLSLFLGEPLTYGCTDPGACNFQEEANADNGSCTSCEVLASACGEGTVWDSAMQQCVSIAPPCAPSCGEGTVWDPVNEECIIAIPADLNYDGCVSVNDLLVLLAVHGTCPPYPEWPDEPTDTTWACGDPLTYWDYDYATVLIGDQCWFAENLATTRYTDGTVIDSGLSNSGWASTTTGAQSAYNDDDTVVSTHGRLYNGYAVDDTRGLCPTNWSVPTDSDFIHLEENLGMPTEEAISLFWRGSDEGQRLKSTTWQNGLDEVGFNALPCGGRNHSSGNFLDHGAIGYWWTQTFNIDGLFYRRMDSTEDRIFRTYPSMNYGFSVRCIKD